MIGAIAMDVQVRPPRRSELRAGRMLLPQASPGGRVPDMLLAVLNDPLRFVGAVSYQQAPATDGIGWDIQLHVARAYRRRGVGSRMMAALRERAQDCRLRALLATLDNPEPGAIDFLKQLGFAFLGRETRYELDADAFAQALAPLRRRLLQRGKVPATVRVAPLAEAPRQEVLRFYTQERFGWVEDAEAHWPAAWDTAAVRDISVALMDASRVIGLGICQATGHELIMPYRLIGTNHRGGWANVLMLAEGASMLAARGIRRAQFIATARTPDAQAAANLYGARPMLCRERYMLPLPKSPGPRGVNQS